MAKIEAIGTNKQQAMLSSPGIVVKTAAPNPHTSADKYFLFIPYIFSYLLRINFSNSKIVKR